MGRAQRGPRRGAVSTEFSISAALLALAGLATTRLVSTEVEVPRAMPALAEAERRARDVLDRLEAELVEARGAAPTTHLVRPVGPGESLQLDLASTLGFPGQGLVVIDRGARFEERVAYQRSAVAPAQLRFLERGELCTVATFHPAGAQVAWLGAAEPLPAQAPPPQPDAFDGLSLEPSGPVFFRGDGVGFAYRLPLEPAADGAGPAPFGAELFGAPDPNAWVALYFAPSGVLTEAECGEDLNRDGDLLDAFDLGQLRRRVWDAREPGGRSQEGGLGPRSVLQERCAWGGDLDADGFDDPLFLWDAAAGQLHVRLFVVGASHEGAPVVRRVERLIALGGGPHG